MSNAPQPLSTPAQPPRPQTPREIKVVSHSNLFYWWPVWAVAFLMALLTYIDNTYMITVPAGTKARVTAGGEEAWVLPEGKRLDREIAGKTESTPKPIKLHMTKHQSYGVIFCITLLLVITITNVPLRGMWSVIVIIVIILMSIIFHLANFWEKIFDTLAVLDIRINMGGYLFIGLGLLAMWLIALFFFDQQIYAVFRPGEFELYTEIGQGKKIYPTLGMKLEQQKADLFRHYILGLGSGDLIVKTSGAAQEHFDLANVLFINKKVQEIQKLIVTIPDRPSAEG